jgi:hypothetical protein
MDVTKDELTFTEIYAPSSYSSLLLQYSGELLCFIKYLWLGRTLIFSVDRSLIKVQQCICRQIVTFINKVSESSPAVRV